VIELLLAMNLHGFVTHSNDRTGAVGIRIGILDHRIQRVWYNTPAERAGLLEGDKILEVCDEDNRHEIDGEVGTEVVIIVKRNGEVLTFHIERAAESTIVRK
jgi:C-terminal processing protease CtpA/Prc